MIFFAWIITFIIALALARITDKSKRIAFYVLNGAVLIIALDNYIGSIRNDRHGVDSFDGAVLGSLSLPLLVGLGLVTIGYNGYVSAKYKRKHKAKV